jgi:hypothetical protein
MKGVASMVARAFWGPRPEAVEDGVGRIVATLAGLRDLDEAHYGRWFDLGKSRSDALRREITIDGNAITARLSQSRASARIAEALGYSFFAWNGAARDEDALSFNCNFATTSPRLTNRVVFDLPSAWEHDLDRARHALDLIVRVWRPERANVWNADRVDLVVADL